VERTAHPGSDGAGISGSGLRSAPRAVRVQAGHVREGMRADEARKKGSRQAAGKPGEAQDESGGEGGRSRGVGRFVRCDPVLAARRTAAGGQTARFQEALAPGT
jgi:hypothetical protein